MLEKVACIFFMTLLGSLGALYLKKVSATNGIKGLLKDVNLYIAIGAYGLSSILNVLILVVMDYVVVLPLCAITYVWTTVLAYLYFKEKITVTKLVGMLFIFAGTAFISFV